MRALMQPLERRSLLSAGLTGQYYDNSNFTNLKLTRTDAQINFNWGAGSPSGSIGADTFSVRWNGYVLAKNSQQYTFYANADDGVRVWVNGQELINQFADHSAATTYSGKINLTAGNYYSIRIDYFEDKNNASMKLQWSSPSTSKAVIPASALFTSVPTSGSSSDSGSSSGSSSGTSTGSSIKYSSPIKITQGGTYSGNWESDSTSTPAVVVETTAPVTISNSNIRSRGEEIATWVNGTNVTIQGTTATALNPDVAGVSPGRFLDDEYFDSITVKNCTLNGTSGIYLDTYSGDGSGTIKIQNNTANNIDGRHSDGNGGFVNYSVRTNKSTGKTDVGYDIVQFLQIAKVHGLAGIDVSGNHVVNQPGQSRVEDNISIYDSSGTSSSPILIHDNYIDGAYNVQPTQGNYSDSTYSYNNSYSGGGIMLGDGDPSDASDESAYVDAYNNTVIDTTNYGIAITSGHDLQFYNNKIYSSGKLSNGQAVFAQNVGAGIWNANGESSSRFYNNGGHDNQIEWFDNGTRNDWWVPGASNWDNNVHRTDLL